MNLYSEYEMKGSPANVMQLKSQMRIQAKSENGNNIKCILCVPVLRVVWF
jgi:hypothetical protein